MKKYKLTFNIQNPNNYECNLFISLDNKPLLFKANESKSLVYYVSTEKVGFTAYFKATDPKILASEKVVIIAEYTRILLETSDGQIFETSDGLQLQLKE